MSCLESDMVVPPVWEDPAATPFVRIEGVTMRFGDTRAVDDVSLSIFRGEFFSLLGASGCGKTTLLRMLAGLQRPSKGRIHIDGANMTRVPPFQRPVNMMFQSYALFPHMTVEDNVAFGLRQERKPRAEIRATVAEMLELVNMSTYARRKPDQLSGGQRQRVALARALARKPKLLLLDEPMGALDRKLRERTRFELMNIQKRVGTTFVMVTHDQEEAMTMSTRMAVMDAGRIVQVGTPAQVYEHPVSRHVAEFVGSVNLFEGCVVSSAAGHAIVHSDDVGEVAVQYGESLPAGTPVAVAIRPEKIHVVSARPTSGHNCVRGRVREVAYLGDVSIYQVAVANGAILQVQLANVARTGTPLLAREQEVYLAWEPGGAVLLTA